MKTKNKLVSHDLNCVIGWEKVNKLGWKKMTVFSESGGFTTVSSQFQIVP